MPGMQWTRWLQCAVAACSAALVAGALAQGPISCRVHDPELQDSYKGGCVNGLAEGLGEAQGKAHYKGEFRGGRKHGKGVKIWAESGDRFEGQFADDKREGPGAYFWGTGSIWAGERYMGAYANDLRHGQGVYEWPTGDRYSGPWENDQPTGSLTPAMRARAQAYVTTVASIARVGIAVCQDRTIGIAVRDVIRGTVLGVEDDMISIRIDNPGQFGHLLQGQLASKGQVVNQAPHFWKPC